MVPVSSSTVNPSHDMSSLCRFAATRPLRFSFHRQAVQQWRVSVQLVASFSTKLIGRWSLPHSLSETIHRQIPREADTKMTSMTELLVPRRKVGASPWFMITMPSSTIRSANAVPLLSLTLDPHV
jgi:hypothetical protein